MINKTMPSPEPAHDFNLPTPGPRDEEAIRLVISDVESGFNTNNADLLLLHVAADAVIVNAVGTVLRGRDAVESATRAGLARGPLQTATAHYRLSDIALVAPDVIVAHKSAWSSAEDARRGASPEMNAHYTFVRREGRWWILRRQNTLVADGQARARG
ncbi:SgcJ/EcaC family oxidoreductase [Cumulibacter soli]|uniref:SgcJ/EcaC family oxidoreductase n=1 Tax=Cumulibacter soli TaxID=2546344 RepID=UPI001ABACAB7|nr:SgcJ/EcaC family oxidoreductase [Cumulibacter soli]